MLIRPDHALFPPGCFPEVSAHGRERRKLGGLFEPSVNLSRAPSLSRMAGYLAGRQPAYVLVVGGGHQRDELIRSLGSPGKVELAVTDVDPNVEVDLFCDALELPFVDGSFDGVIATAVLEHVTDPWRSAEEILRVLCGGGVVYSELPFMQQVHEGAYDFTRFSHAGHRRLFRCFREIESGVVAGPATALVWALEAFGVCLSPPGWPRKVVRGLVRAGFGWLRHLDRLWGRWPVAMDGASCTFFLGVKEDGYVRDDSEIVAGYVGDRRRQHRGGL